VSGRSYSLLLVVVLLVAAIVGLFAIDAGQSDPEPADFDQTVTIGLSLEHERWLEDEREAVTLPRVQTFYSEYPYVVGYFGVEQFVAVQDEPRYEQLFGYPMTIYVSAFDAAELDLTEDNLPTVDGDGEWTPAPEATYVVDSQAQTPAGPTVVPLETADGAEAFSDEYGGTVLTWEEVLDQSFETDDAETVRQSVSDQQLAANQQVANASNLRDRPESLTVGEDGETIQDAIEAAPPNTSVLVPEGVYEEEIEVEKPITLKGKGDVSIVGDGNGTVVTLKADRSAIVNVDISGVGGDTPGAGPTDGHDHGGSHDHGESDDDEAWDEVIEDDYARGDAGVAVNESRDVLVEDVHVVTPASGVMLRDSPDAVIRDLQVVGSPNEFEAHMGVVLMRSPAVVERSSFTHGLDGVYTHRADGSVIRDNEMTENRMGIHLMHTSDTLLANNTISEQSSTGIFVMTGPERNAVVGNDIHQTPTALDMGGTDSYVAANVFHDNEVGLRADGTATIIEENALVSNELGLETWALLPTNRVVENDFVDNDRHVRSVGPLRVWSHDGVGNYWEGAVGLGDDGVLDRPYSPTDDIDSQLHSVDGTPTIAQAPALDALDWLEQAASGLRSGDVIDDSPRCHPVNDEWLEAHGYTPKPYCETP